MWANLFSASGPIIRTYPAMNQRELSKFLTLVLGRKPRKDRGIPRKPTSRLLRQPSYRRVRLRKCERLVGRCLLKLPALPLLSNFDPCRVQRDAVALQNRGSVGFVFPQESK